MGSYPVWFGLTAVWLTGYMGVVTLLPQAAVSIHHGNSNRLPYHVIPTQYDLHLQPNLDPGFTGVTRTFIGEVRIQVKVLEETGTITLHAVDIDIKDISVRELQNGTLNDEDILQENGYKFEEEREFLILSLTEIIHVNAVYEIAINYSGILRDDMTGFYLSSYKDTNMERRLLAATHFQAAHSRKAFPCFDEPSFKARFLVTIVAPTDMQVLSNMPAERTIYIDSDFKEVSFENSMVMSSYLLAFVIVPFKGATDVESHAEKVNFTTWARPDAISWAQYSLQVSPPMLHVLEEYTGILYNVSGTNKVDQVALPEFSSGAMENWGLITYRETALLYNDGSADAIKFVSMVIAHELTHMWFGNLVTTCWWGSTWLNEGFARFFQYYVVDQLNSDWRMWDHFVVDEQRKVFAHDALLSAHALTHFVNTSAEASASFSPISYDKGAAILRMISYTIGQKNFQAALHLYLQDHMFRCVKPTDLFTSLKSISNPQNLSTLEFDQFLNSWTEQAGFPVISVLRDYDSRTALIFQKRFLFQGESTDKYYVPLTWTMEGRTFDVWQPDTYFKPTDTTLQLTGMPARSSWVIFNVQSTGYYRVNYDQTNWKLLADHLQNLNKPLSGIHVLNRAQLLDDALNLARAGLLRYDSAFRVADYLPRETELAPWASAFNAFSYLDRMLVNHVQYPVFQRYVWRLLDKVYRSFDFKFPEEHDKRLLLNSVATWACSLGDHLCNLRAVQDITSHLNSSSSVPPDLRSVVYCYGIRNGEDTLWERMWNTYKESRDDVERELIVQGLACSKNTSRLSELLEYSIAGEDIRRQDAASVFSAVYAKQPGVDVALTFLDDNFYTVIEYFGSPRTINSMITGLAGHLTSTDHRNKFMILVTKYGEELGKTGEVAIEIVNNNLWWIEAFGYEIFWVLQEKERVLFRLPQWLSPHHYNLYLEPVFNDKSLLGNVIILATANVRTDTITLHSEDINVTFVSVEDVSLPIRNEFSKNYSYDQQLGLFHIYLRSEITPGNEYRINISYSGRLREDMRGFYISSYEDDNGNIKEFAATRFEPTHARKAFPCFDEPHFKATFDVTIKSPPYYRATLGNMPQHYIRVWDDFSTEITYHTTPKMSTYLLALVVSDFVSMNDTEGTVEFRTWTRHNVLPWANYSIQVSRNILEALEKYTGLPYTDPTLEAPLTKVDQVAVPDFSVGAMENWGLVMYHETTLLFNDGPASARQSIATTISHELAHMWFGNLVTTDWWDAAWLNEGFAQYFQYFIADEMEPRWRLMDQFLVDIHQAVFASDSLANSAALTADAFTPAEIRSRFKGITYSKGASVLRMISSILGAENFREVLQTYLKTNAYKTTKPVNLFDQFVKKSEVANLSEVGFRSLLHSWTEQPGFPVVYVQRDYEAGKAIITQNRFFLKKSEARNTILSFYVPLTWTSYLYYVPLTWTSEGESFDLRTPQQYITNEEENIIVQMDTEANKWVIFNVQESGFYRVNYDVQNWKLIIDYLNDEKNPLDGIHVLNRAQLLDDAFNLARAGQLSYETAVSLSDYLQRERDYIPWISALNAFAHLQHMLINHAEYPHFKHYVLQLLEDVYLRYNFEDHHEHVDKLLLNLISSWACSLGYDHCVNSAVKALTQYINSDIKVSADLRSVSYCYGIRHSTNLLWDQLWKKYINSFDVAEKTIIMAGLACSHNTSKLEELLLHTISGNIRKQDASSIFSYVCGNSVGVEVVLDFLNNNFLEVLEHYGSVGAINIVIGISGRLTTEEQRDKMVMFVMRYSDYLGAAAGYALKTIDENLEWLKEHAEEILHTLHSHTQDSTTSSPSSGHRSRYPQDIIWTIAVTLSFFVQFNIVFMSNIVSV